MKDENKTKSQLIDELREMRKLLSELEKEKSEIVEAALLTRSILEKAPIGIWRMGLDGKVLDVNEQGCDSLGYSKEELCQKTAFDFSPGFNPPNWEDQISKIHKDGYRTIEVFHQRKDGTTFPIQVIEKLLRFGKHDYHIAFVQDITERRQREKEIREKEILLHDVETQAKIGGWKVDLETGEVSNTDEISKIYDLDNKEPVSIETGLSLYTEDSRKKVEKAFNEAVRKGTPYELNLELISAKGIHKWVHTMGYSIREQGHIVSVQGSLQDITDIRQAEESLTLTRAIIDKANIGIYILSLDGQIREANQAAADLLGYSKEELETLSITDIDPKEASNSWFPLIEDLHMLQGRIHEREHRKKDGTPFPVEIHGYFLNHNDNQYVIAFVQDISERKNIERRMKELATTDELTKLMNRRSFFEQGHKEIQRNRRNGHPVSGIMFDIDHFKRVNDTYGHDAGDKVLKSLALNVKTVLRNMDMFARLGGEEFAVILPETSLAPALVVAERIRKKIEAMVISYTEISISITISLGVTQLRELETTEDMLKRADESLYQAKKSGRNRVCHS